MPLRFLVIIKFDSEKFFITPKVQFNCKNFFINFSGPMIETILVVCSSKEERQRWMELLSQDRGSSLAVRAPTTQARVSCSHPPYSRLTRFYARLVRKRIIHTELLKRLLYSQYTFKPDMSSVKMRKCKVTYTIYPNNKSGETSSSTASTSSEGLPMEKRRHKSSINLDVRYVVDNSADQRLNLPADTNAFSLGSYNSTIDRSTSETSKSAPADFPVLSNDLLLSGASKPFWQEKMEIGGGMKQWRADIDLSQNEDVNSQLNEANREELKTVVGAYRPLRASLRSSDSGMADSYHLNSSEINSSGYKLYEQTRSRCTDRNVTTTSHSESENDENKYEHQCICTSPFGSTPRQSKKSMVASSESSSESSDDSDCPEEESCSSRLLLSNENDMKIAKRFTTPIPLEHQNVVKKVSRRAHYWRDREPDEEQQPQVYTSGLYAHWWLKKKIPLSGLVEQGKLPWHGC